MTSSRFAVDAVKEDLGVGVGQDLPLLDHRRGHVVKAFDQARNGLEH